ncbi:Phage transcriptional regulator, AlpA [Candidatus Methylopumilus planktonicus]|uniref:Phage transcriptional regulator, AlpA n=1 Tax=Candidatus Methylopumilus planktonicus TaxID=1581557 RepID=A0A0D6EU63_9PROT|nr:AlpA family transcriptional regulator [Candidatus Methylopumilus planktonicus]CEZ19035.1 Phage transcriptional regulator, AlpA [Candidatus Methylopumilus planktonicus]
MEDLRILKLKEVCSIVGLKPSTIYKLMSSGDFPKQVKLTAKSVGWANNEINHWISLKIGNTNVPH